MNCLGGRFMYYIHVAGMHPCGTDCARGDRLGDTDVPRKFYPSETIVCGRMELNNFGEGNKQMRD